MLASFDLWLEYLIRFSHVVAGISWIGSSFYFIWLDSSFETPQKPRHNVDGEVFMVHGGFYYQVDKKKIAPGEVPSNLHWFKWEATLTFITGFLLFIYLYFLNSASLLIAPDVMDLSHFQAILFSTGLIIISWFVYDLLYHPNSKIPAKVTNCLALTAAVALIYFLPKVFSGRGAYMLAGVIFGSCMLLNVWVRILPGQAKMLASAQAGEVPDYSLGLKSKARSVHNTYFIFPVLFIMISNHYPAVYNHQYAWIMLIILFISGAMLRQAMITKIPAQRWLYFPAAIGFLTLVFITAHKEQLTTEPLIDSISYSDVKEIVSTRCLSCHSNNNTDDIFKVAQKGIILENEDLIKLHLSKIIPQVENKVMPLANKTQMTPEERALFLEYLKSLKN